MTPASAERLARHLHQYDLYGAGIGRDRGSVTYDREVRAGYPYIETLRQGHSNGTIIARISPTECRKLRSSYR